ncbi:MAG: orotate phosphoribosyltransferase [Acidobacteriota bacterium]|nr:orotate phosphoribosyltransferase [Acidobacteriota bacterium]MDQ7088126.1 orotate phosphoribosyltransferase [Acidobacteriota bacterium]
MNRQKMRQRLAEVLREHSLERGHFVLASGRTSDYYLDCRRTTLHPEGALLVGRLLWMEICGRGWKAAAVGGLTLGADPVATAVAIASQLEGRGVGAFIVRKQAKAHGARRRIEGQLPAAGGVVLVEDVVTTGGSTLDAAACVREAGLEILGALAVVDREEGGAAALAEAKIPFGALFTARELLAGA